MKVLSHLLVVFSLLIAVSACAQRINPATQIQKSPGNAAGYILRSNSSGELGYVLNTAPGTGTVAPSGPPPAGSSGIYLNTTTGQLYTWNGSAWNLLSSGSGTTNLAYTTNATTGTVTSDTGNDALIPAATTIIAGLMTAADKTSLQDIETALAAGGQSENGLTGTGLSADKYRLGSALTQNTTIPGADFGFTLNNAGTILLESDNTAGTVKSELALTSSNVIGTYLRSVNESNTSNVSQLSLDIDGIHGLQWTTTAGQPLGFIINPNTTTATAGITVATRNIALGNATSGQVLTLQPDGTVEYNDGAITNLTYASAASTGTVVSDTGTDATIPASTTTTAGLMTATDKTNLDATDNVFGVSAGSNNLGTFTGTILPDNSDVKTVLQTTETNLASINSAVGITPGATNMGTFSGTVLPDNSDVKTVLQAIETNISAGGQSENGMSGTGLTGDKYRLGGALTQNTTIAGADFGYTLNNAGTIVLESDNISGAVRTELALTSSNVLGSYIRSINESNASNVSSLSLDIDGTHGLQWTITAGQPLGFLINPNATTATSGITVATRNHALGTAVTGQVLTRQADGTVEYQSVSGGGITTYSAGSGAIVTASGAGVTFTRTTASVWTFDIPSGVELLSFDINSTASQSATAALDIDFVFAGTRPYNQDVSADMTDAKVPVITTLKKINPSTFPTTAAGNNAAWSTDVTATGTLRISTTEFGEVSSAGANATTVKGIF